MTSKAKNWSKRNCYYYFFFYPQFNGLTSNTQPPTLNRQIMGQIESTICQTEWNGNDIFLLLISFNKDDLAVDLHVRHHWNGSSTQYSAVYNSWNRVVSWSSLAVLSLPFAPGYHDMACVWGVCWIKEEEKKKVKTEGRTSAHHIITVTVANGETVLAVWCGGKTLGLNYSVLNWKHGWTLRDVFVNAKLYTLFVLE